MFTGIVAGVGRIAAAPAGGLRVEHELAAGLRVGGSIAVNGACLTVVEAGDAAFWADVVPETLRRTNLGRLAVGDEVNLEPPLRLGDPVDGHLVQGHVDAVVEVLAAAPTGLGVEVAFRLPAQLARYIAEKGSVAVDGISLTVAAADRDSFAVALVPHTLRSTIAGGYRPGSIANLEVDSLARHVERLLAERQT